MENNIRVNPLKYPNVKCDCGCEIWNQGVILKKIPGLEVGNGMEDTYIDLPVWYCIKCGKMLPEYRKIYKLDENTEEKTPEEKKPTILLT